MSCHTQSTLFLLLLYTFTTNAVSLGNRFAQGKSSNLPDLFSDSLEDSLGASKKAPWQSYHWDEDDDDKDKRTYSNENSADPLGRDVSWASIEFDKKAPWASYDFKRSQMDQDLQKRDPWAYPRLNSLLSYINRRGRNRFLKSSTKRTRINEVATPADEHTNDEIYEKRSAYGVPDKQNMVERLLSISKQPSKRETRSLEQTILDIASKRRLGRVREPSDIHPVNMGLGQHAAGYALDTYSRLLADEQRRLQEGASGGRPGGAPVRFIGK